MSSKNNSTGMARTGAYQTPEQLKKNWDKYSSDLKVETGDGIQVKEAGLVTNGTLDDKHLFLDNRRGSLGAKFDISDEYSLDVRDAPLFKKLAKHPHSNVPSGFRGDILLSPDWAAGLKGYLKDGVRNLGLRLDDNRMPVLSKVKGSEFAHKTHEDVINYYLRQAPAKDQMIDEFLMSEETSFGIRWDHDTSPQNAHKKFVKQLAKAQVFWLEPFVAQLIDAGADALYEEGKRTGVWPIITTDEMTQFDMNMFVVSVGVDEFSGATWPTIHWFHMGRSFKSPSIEMYHTASHEEIADATNGVKNVDDFTNNPIVRTPSSTLLAMGFDDWGRMDVQTSWNFDETMMVFPNVTDANGKGQEEHDSYPEYMVG